MNGPYCILRSDCSDSVVSKQLMLKHLSVDTGESAPLKTGIKPSKKNPRMLFLLRDNMTLNLKLTW